MKKIIISFFLLIFLSGCGSDYWRSAGNRRVTFFDAENEQTAAVELPPGASAKRIVKDETIEVKTDETKGIGSAFFDSLGKAFSGLTQVFVTKEILRD